MKLLKLIMILTPLLSMASQAQGVEDVWQHHIDAWSARDLAEIVSDYDEDSLMIVNNVVFKGPEEIAQVFDQLFTIFDRGQNTIDPSVIEGRIVYITWHFTPLELDETFGTDTFVIEDGKIKVQTIASPLYDLFPVLRNGENQ